MCHASVPQATTQRLLYCKQFLLRCCLCATGDHHINTPLFMFSCPPLPPRLLSSEDVSSSFLFSSPPTFFSFFFLHDRSGPAGEVPPLPSCFVQRMKSEESDERSICWGGWGRRQSKERWWAEGGKGLLLLFFFRLLTTLAPNDVCVYVWERQTAWIFPCSHHSTGIFTAGGPALPPSGGLDGQITFTIYKIQKLCLDKTS